MEFTKEHEGKTIIAVPTGNNARSMKYSNEKYREFRVVKVKRKYVELCTLDGHLKNNYDPESGATQKDINAGYSLNAGYIFFESKEDYLEWKTTTTIVGNIEKMTRDIGLGRNS